MMSNRTSIRRRTGRPLLKGRRLRLGATIAALSLALGGAGLPHAASADTAATTPTTTTAPPAGDVFPGALAFDAVAKTVTLPVNVGSDATGSPVAYIVTESSNQADAAARHVNWSPKLANALGTKAVQQVDLSDGGLRFSGTVDFSPERVVVAGPTGFPPSQATPGSVADAAYSPLVTTGDGIVLNAPQIAGRTGIHDQVISFDWSQRSVTLHLLAGFYDGADVLYVRTESSDPVVAAVEGTTLAPNLAFAPGAGSDDPATSAREAIVPIVNGELGATNPERQGLDSFLFGEGDPLNIIQEEPGGTSSLRYSPVWDVTPAVWTDAAIAAGARHRLRSVAEVATEVAAGHLTNGADGPANNALGGLHAAKIISLCPIIFVAARGTNAG